jgi:ABC-type transporter Mla subunit MlaD
MTAGQTTLGEYAESDEDQDGDDLDDLRRDLDQLTDLVGTIAKSQQDLADAVEGALDDGDDGTATDADADEDLVDTSPGFQ